MTTQAAPPTEKTMPIKALLAKNDELFAQTGHLFGLKDLKRKQEDPGGYEAVSRTFRRWRDRLDVDALSPHAARHGFVTELVASGLDVGVVQALARHETPGQTLNYYHAGPDAAAAVAKVSLRNKATRRLRKVGKPAS